MKGWTFIGRISWRGIAELYEAHERGIDKDQIRALGHLIVDEEREAWAEVDRRRLDRTLKKSFK